MEELSLAIDVGPIACVDYIEKDWEDMSVIMLIFTCTRLSGADIIADNDEIMDWKFFAWNEAINLVSARMKVRLRRILYSSNIYGESLTSFPASCKNYHR